MQLQKQLADIAARVESGEFFYTRFFAIGIFRLLELTESRDPKALEGLIKVHPACFSSFTLFLARLTGAFICFTALTGKVVCEGSDFPPQIASRLMPTSPVVTTTRAPLLFCVLQF